MHSINHLFTMVPEVPVLAKILLKVFLALVFGAGGRHLERWWRIRCGGGGVFAVVGGVCGVVGGVFGSGG